MAIQIRKLEIEGLYGSLDRKMDFHPDLNLLVGINGSGKTSVLHCIDWLLRFDYVSLSLVPFSRIALDLNYGGREIQIEVTKNKERVDLHIHGAESEMSPFNIRLAHDGDTMPTGEEYERFAKIYSSLRPEAHEMPIWNYVTKMPKPTLVALDRTLRVESDDRVFADPMLAARAELFQRNKSPLTFVRRVTSARFSKFQSREAQLNDELKARLVLAALSDPPRGKKRGRADELTVDQIDDLESKVVNQIAASLKEDEVTERVRKFFKRARRVAKLRAGQGSERAENAVVFISGQFAQLEEFASAFNQYEKKLSEAYVKLDVYLKAVNSFLADSKKRICFSPKSGGLAYRVLDGKGQERGQEKDIRSLSSGEQQVLVLMTFLAFGGQGEGLFVVDEPELSLHPKWQKEFLSAFLSLKPAGTQLLIATHSPEIVANHKSNCIVLRP